MKAKYIYPVGISPEGKQLLVMLHGYGSNELDLFGLKDRLPDELFPVSLRGYYETPFGGYAWFPLYMDAAGELHANEQEVMNTVKDLLDDIRELQSVFRTDGPVHLLGFSQGSILSYLLITWMPDFFRLTVAFSGYIYEKVLPPTDPASVQHLRVFASHGIYDEIIPVEKARKIPEILKEKGIYVEYREYPAGHYLTEENIADAMAFLRRFL